MTYDPDLVKMLESISFSPSTTQRSPNRFSDDYIQNARLEARQRKANKIADLLSEPNFNRIENLSYFRQFANSTGGLLDGEYRLDIWPVLGERIPCADGAGVTLLKVPDRLDAVSTSTGSDSDFFESARSSFSSVDPDDDDDESVKGTKSPVPSFTIEELQTHAEWNQVELDVNRTLARFPPNISETERLSLQSELTPLIVELLFANKSYRYYQGFHDVCLTLILALDVDRAREVSKHLCERGSFHNYLTKSLEESALRELHLMYVILHHCCSDVEERLRVAELGTLFALSWPITWFSHALHSFEQIVLCFDMFLSSHYLMPIYAAAALVEHRRKEIMKCEPEMPPLHHLLNHVPDDIDIQAVLDRAHDLFNLYPPALVQGKYLREYEKMCARERQIQRLPPANALRRHSVLNSPWVVMGTAAAGMAAYWWLSKYTGDVNMSLF